VCLSDSPTGSKLNISVLEGLNFDADAQCRAAYGSTARLCPARFAVQVPTHNNTNGGIIAISSLCSNCVPVFGASLPLVRTVLPEMYLQQMELVVVMVKIW